MRQKGTKKKEKRKEINPDLTRGPDGDRRRTARLVWYRCSLHHYSKVLNVIVKPEQSWP